MKPSYEKERIARALQTFCSRCKQKPNCAEECRRYQTYKEVLERRPDLREEL